MRILVTVSPLMYREVIALSIHNRCPDFEVLLAPPRPTDVRTGSFGPHVLVHDAEEAELPPALAGSVVCRVEVLYTDSMATRVSMADGRSYTIEDACMDDLLAIVDEAEALRLASRSGTERASRGRAASPSVPLRRPPPRRGSPLW